MIEVDNPPLILLLPIIIVFTGPFLYSFFIDKHDKGKKPPIMS